MTTLLAPTLLATAACGAPQRGGSKTAVGGRVVLAPATPVCTAGKPCSKPLAGFTLAFS